MAYYRDQEGHPRSVRELVRRVGRSTALGSTLRSALPTTSRTRSGTSSPQSASLEEEMGVRFTQCRTRLSSLENDTDRPGPSRSTGRTRFQPYNRIGQRSTTSATAGRTFSRTIFLLHHDECTIPRGPQRQLMYEEGRVVDFVELQTTWNEDVIYRAIEDIFADVFSDDETSPRFEFVKPCFGKVVVPKVTSGHSWTGERVKALTQQGHDLYIRSLQPLKMMDMEGETCNKNEDNSTEEEHDGESEDGIYSRDDSSQPCCSKHLKLTEQLQLSKEMFPNVPLTRLEEVTSLNGVDDSINVPLEEIPTDVHLATITPAMSLPAKSSLQTILSVHTSHLMEDTDDLFLKIHKADLWPRVLSFYKEMKSDVSKLCRNINIEFIDEEGSDAGALKITFFEMLLRDIDAELFEGNPNKRVPKKDWGLDAVMEIAGIMVGHSILCGGPGFNCLHPAHYYMMHTGVTSSEALSPEFLPTVEDIPQSPGYCDLLDLIHQLTSAETKERINSILDEPRMMSIISASKWPSTMIVTKENRFSLLQNLVLDELITKRTQHLLAFLRGLEKFGLGTLCREFPEKCQDLFVYDETTQLTANRIVKLITSSPRNSLERGTLGWFIEYIALREDSEGSSDEATLPQLMNFITGSSSIPPLGFREPIEIKFLPPSQVGLAEADACFNTIRLPVLLCKGDFIQAMDKAILYSFGYYGRI